jgi:hypothetical protein
MPFGYSRDGAEHGGTEPGEPVLRIHDIWCGSGSADPCLWLMDLDPDPAPAQDPVNFVIDLQDANKKQFFKSFFAY